LALTQQPSSCGPILLPPGDQHFCESRLVPCLGWASLAGGMFARPTAAPGRARPEYRGRRFGIFVKVDFVVDDGQSVR
jgi:hypothetical protein